MSFAADRPLPQLLHHGLVEFMKTLLTILALLLAMSAQAKLSVERRQTFNASILNFDAHRYAVNLHTSDHGYHAGNRLKLRGSRLDYNGHVVVEEVQRGHVLIVRYAKPRSQRAEPLARLTITRYR